MEVIDFIKDERVQSCLKRHEENRRAKDRIKYNLFTLSIYNSQLENFHSDVLESLLNPSGLHNEGGKFLELFIRFLNSELNLEINESDFLNAKTERETGDAESHIDIVILGISKSIIIENKMNNAPDMPEQLDRYYNLLAGRDKEPVAIIYLTLDGIKNAPTPDNLSAQKILRNIGAYDNTVADLITGWLEPCWKVCSNEDSRSLIFQYIKLIKHLSSKSMDNEIMESFYRFVSDKDGIKTAEDVIELTKRIPEYRTDKLIKALKDYKPFRYSGKWKYNYQCYDGFRDGDNTFKFDISYGHDGKCFLWFWIPLKPDRSGGIIVYEKLKSIGLDKDFEPRDEKQNGYTKYFTLGADYKTMPEMDEAILKFVSLFLEKLRTTEQHG